MKRSGSPYAGLRATILLAVGVVGWTMFSNTDEYPGPWMSDLNPFIVEVLVRNNIQDCGEFYYRRRRDSRNTFPDYLVRCAANGVTWNDYLVFPATDAALETEDYGDLSIPKPRVESSHLDQ